MSYRYWLNEQAVLDASARRGKRITLDHIAACAGVTKQAVSLWNKRGLKNINAGHTVALAAFLGVEQERVWLLVEGE
jgi:hypothetical protein